LGKATGIQWCDSTVNCTSGCDGCELWSAAAKGPCYAGHLHEARLARSMPALYAADFTEVRMIPGRMAKAAGWSDLTGTARPGKPWLDGIPRVVFVDDMGDLFSKAVTFEFIRDEVTEVARNPKGRRHVWMLLTKRPSRMYAFSAWLGEQGLNWPRNVWAGASVTTAKTLTRAAWLKKVPAPVRFLSLEPQWEYVDLRDALASGEVHLVIQGGESDQGAHEGHPFDLGWARSVRDQCAAAGARYFLKQFGSRPYDSGCRVSIDGPDSHAVALDLSDSHGGDWSEWPEDLRVREMPRVPDRNLV
jgi:protein gp37